MSLLTLSVINVIQVSQVTLLLVIKSRFLFLSDLTKQNIIHVLTFIHLYVCMYLCMYVCMYVCMYIGFIYLDI